MKEKITLSLDQHENARHGEEIFPLQKYVTPLWKEYPYVTAHWHEEAEFTRMEKGSCTYQIHLETYEVEEGDLIFIPPAVLHAISNEKEECMQSETYVFHMDFLGAKAADICAIRYLNPKDIRFTKRQQSCLRISMRSMTKKHPDTRLLSSHICCSLWQL